MNSLVAFWLLAFGISIHGIQGAALLHSGAEQLEIQIIYANLTQNVDAYVKIYLLASSEQLLVWLSVL